MYTDSQLARAVESRDDLEQDRHDEEGARQDYHAARVEQVRAPLERRMVRFPSADELVQAMANVLAVDAYQLAIAWRQCMAWDAPASLIGIEFKTLAVAELRKMADIAAETQVQREEREQEAEAQKSKHVRLGDEY